MLAVETATLGGQEVGGVGASRSRAKRMRADRGAVIVEYALVLALVLVPSFCTIQQLDKSSSKEVNHQADCIATRPPPPLTCQPRSVTTLPPSWVIPTSTTTTQPPSTPSGTLSFLNPATADLPNGTWDAIVFASFQVAGDPVTPGVGATVRVRVTITAPANPTPFFIQCVTAPDGLCELRFTTPAPGVTALRFDFETLEGFDGIVTVNPAALPPTYMHP